MSYSAKVAIVRCTAYTEPQVTAAVQRGMDLLGGMARFIQPGEAIVLKPNVLVGDSPEKLVGPHPLVFQALAQQAGEITHRLSYGDSPANGRPAGQMRRAGLAEIAQNLGIALADFENGREVTLKNSPFLQRFVLANGVLDSDGLISISKLKTHQLTRITGAIKNQFGCVPGLLKPEYHLKLPNPLDFAKMLVCLNLYIRPRLCVMDGVVAMQGNGPRGGDPVQMNVLLFSDNPAALDAAVCRLIDLKPEYVPTLPPARAWGLGTYLTEEIEWLGDPVESLVNKNFNVVRAPVTPVTRSSVVPFLTNLVSPRLVIDPARCNQCGTCVRMCPAKPKSVDWHAGVHTRAPTYQYERCIRCFCCQEMCPEHAISVQTPLLGRLLGHR